MKSTHLDYLPNMVAKFEKKEKGHKLGVKRICKIKKHPPTTRLSVDEDIETPLKWRKMPTK